MTRVKFPTTTSKTPISETEAICRYVAMLSDIPDSHERSRLLQEYVRLLLEPPKTRGRLANAGTRRAQHISNIEIGETLDRIMSQYDIGLYKACEKLAELRELDGDAASGLRKAYSRYKKSPFYRQSLKHWLPPVSSRVRPD